MKNTIAILALVFILVSSAGPSQAEQNAPAPLHGLAMHGAPKYGPDFTHLDYVNPDAPKGGRLIQAVVGTFDSLNPYAIRGTAAQGMHFYYDRLMARVWDEPFTLYPLIAERVEIPEDRSSITVHINEAARFHDGSPITAEDVLFSFETLKNDGRPNMRRVYGLVERAEITGPHSVHFAFGDGYDRETVMIIAMMPVLSKAWWNGRDFDSATLEPPLSNGPYRIVSFEAGRRIVYERVPDYWAADLPVNRGHFNFERIVFDYYRDESVALEAFTAGNTDLRREWDAGRWASSYDVPAVRDGRIIRETIDHGRPERTRALIFNSRRPPFDDIKVRQALSHLLDFEWINRNLFHGQYKRIDSYFSNSELAATGLPTDDELALLEPLRAYLSDDVFGEAWAPPTAGGPQEMRAFMLKADALLREAGWVVQNGRRVREDNPARQFRFEIIVNAPDDEKIALHFRRSLERMGIDATIRVLDTSAFIGRLGQYDYDMVLYQWQNSLSPGTEQVLYWTCMAAEQQSRWNYAGICNEAVDSLSYGIASAYSRDDLVAHARALDRVLTHGWYMIPLHYAGTDFVAYRNAIRRPDTIPLYGMVLENWWDSRAE